MIVDIALYRQGVRVAAELPLDELGELRDRTEPGDFMWVDLVEPTLVELSQLQLVFALHPLAVEDAVKATQRTKLERYPNHLFFTLKTLWYVDAEDAVETGEIYLFFGPDFVITVRHGEGNDLSRVRTRLEERHSVLEHGPSSVVYEVCDGVVDGYENVAECLVEDVDEVEASVFSADRTSDAERIYVLKRELAEVRRAVVPLRDPIGRFASGMIAEVADDAAEYFRDVADHLARVSDAMDSLDSLLSTAFDAHIAQISIQQNDDMRKISAGAALVVVPTLIAGIYGMNFEHMPELGWAYGYPFALLTMGVVVTVLLVFFKRSGWL